MTPLIIAHRGASRHAPENTLAAFRMAVEAGAGGIELDVQLSKDCIPVVFHDADLRRIARRRERVSDLTADELAKVDVGAWFDKRKRSTHTFAGEGIPTLAKVLEQLEGFAGKLYVELKSDPHNSNELSRTVCNALRDSALLSQVIMKSFYLDTLVEIKQHLPNIQTAALFSPQIRKRNYIQLAREYGADQLSLHFSLATARVCALARDANMPVTVWTVDHPRWVEHGERRGIAALITNDPAKMLAAHR